MDRVSKPPPLDALLLGTVQFAKNFYGIDMLEMYPDDAELAHQLMTRADEFCEVDKSDLVAEITHLRSHPEKVEPPSHD